MSNVVGLRGEEIKDDRTPVDSVVEECEALLERAKSGEITGIAIAQHWRDGASGVMLAGELSWGLVGRIEQLKSTVIDLLESN